ncbi:hypothetical protein RDI58_018386 [Solanum bulbocastanum]|uniref:Uncharacterized protein n=1 Tax=Solanum bulbocastanum TaxID=147425 RepID=A0AAN8YAX1_SOLBU
MNGILEALTQTRASYTVLNRISGHRACPPPDVPLAGELSIAIVAPYAWFCSTLPSELPLPESRRGNLLTYWTSKTTREGLGNSLVSRWVSLRVLYAKKPGEKRTRRF